jgi:hypothetical protein
MAGRIAEKSSTRTSGPQEGAAGDWAEAIKANEESASKEFIFGSNFKMDFLFVKRIEIEGFQVEIKKGKNSVAGC